MSQQPLDLRRSVHIIRRHTIVFLTLVALGLLVGAGYAVLYPPVLTSTALVVLPQAPAQDNQATSTGTAGSSDSSYMATQAVIATSDAVLGGALRHVSPAMSLQSLDNQVKVTSLTGSILSFAATGKTAAQAEMTANAVANSYIAYIGNKKSSPVGHVPARMLEPAASATGSRMSTRLGLLGLLGALVGALVGFFVSLVVGHSDRRLAERDEIANSIGAPVLASIPVGRPSDAKSWAKLLEKYEPGPVQAWALSKLLRHFGLADLGHISDNETERAGAFSLTVLSVASDRRALALGPQLAAFAASRGIPTALIIGPQQDMNAVATLRTACAALSEPAAGRRRPLRLIVSDDGHIEDVNAAFSVVVTVVDGRDPQISGTFGTTAAVLGVTAGVDTAAQLAQAATAAAAAGLEISGFLVANPEPTDQTTGLVPRLAPLLRNSVPTRVKDVPTESKR